jgi:hypothetical protein
MRQNAKNKLVKFLFYSTVIFNPAFWVMSSKYNPNIDKFINDILDRNVKGDLNTYTISFGDVSVWIASYPHSYATLRDSPINGRASRYTIYRFKKYIDELQKHKKEIMMNGMSEKEYLSLERIAMNMLVKDD